MKRVELAHAYGIGDRRVEIFGVDGFDQIANSSQLYCTGCTLDAWAPRDQDDGNIQIILADAS